MAKRFSFFVLFCLFFSFLTSWILPISSSIPSSLSHTTDLTVEERPYLILISIDGYRPDYTDRYHLPAIQSIRDDGASAQSLRPVYPSLTFPNHYSIITGQYAETHGLVANNFYDPVRQETYRLRDKNTVTDGTWYGGTPLWVLAEKQGVRSASFFWIGSEAEIQGIRPTYYRKYDPSIPNQDRVDQVIEWLKLPPEERPHFITLYFSDVDAMGHRYGTTSTELQHAAQNIDHAIGTLRQALTQIDLPVNIILLSDHGMQDVSSDKIVVIDLLEHLDQFKIIWNGAGTHAFLYANPGTSPGEIESIYDQLNSMADHFTAYKKSDIPPTIHFKANRRIPDILVEATAPYRMGTSDTLNYLKSIAGTHGYNPYTTPSMAAIFYATGPNIRQGVRLATIDSVDVYPFMATLLGLHITGPIDGQPGALDDLLTE